MAMDLNVCFCLCMYLFVAAVLGNTINNRASSSENLISNDLQKCSSKKGGVFTYISCSTMTALKSVRKADEEASFEILPGVSLVKDDQQVLRRGKELKVEELPTDSRLRAVKLAEMLMDASTNFISGRSLKISLPKMGPVAVSRALEEGRAKVKKMVPLLYGMGAKIITAMSVVFSSLALISTKALIVGKLALAVSVILFVQYLFSSGRGIIGSPYGSYGGYGAYGGYGGINPTYGTGLTTNNLGGTYGAPQYPYARSIDDEKSAQDLAYAEQKAEN